MKRILDWVGIILAFSGGILAGWIDFNNGEPQAAVLVILAVTFLLGLFLPRKGWVWAVIVALCLPGVYLVAHSLGFQPVSSPSPGWYASLLALIPAFIGAYTGVIGRLLVNPVFIR